MAARNFSEDGAVGAMTGQSPADTTGTAVGGVTVSDPGPGKNFNMTGSTSTPSASGLSDLSGINGGWGGGGLSGGSDSGSGLSTSIGAGSDRGGWGGGGLSGGGGFGTKAVHDPSYYSGDDQSNQGPGNAFQPQYDSASVSFSQGGAIDEDGDEGDPNATDPQGSAMGNSLQQSINRALSTVTNTLSYGRQLHGLGGGQQQAQRMPTVPGNQSESGVPRERPMPGPLAPTSNPFGKRADAGGTNNVSSDNDSDDQPSAQAIDTDEEAA